MPFLARIATTQNSALTSLITSKDQEYEMRSNALKRLAFVLLSSEMDQYHPQLPEIQGKSHILLKNMSKASFNAVKRDMFGEHAVMAYLVGLKFDSLGIHFE